MYVALHSALKVRNETIIKTMCQTPLTQLFSSKKQTRDQKQVASHVIQNKYKMVHH